MINSFTGEYRFLSNFYPSEFEAFGYTWPTVEHFFQACKSRDPEEDMPRFARCPTPGAAKRLGRTVRLVDDWESFWRYERMELGLRLKFSHLHPDLCQKLVATYPRMLVEGNTWGDITWGQVDGKGSNLLGWMLMRIREHHWIASDKETDWNYLYTHTDQGDQR